MLHIGHHCRIVHIILLHCVVGTNSEECSSRSIVCYAANAIYSRYRLVGYMLRSDIPRPRFPAGVELTPLNDLTGLGIIISKLTYPSRYCTIFPFFDHAIHLGSAELESDRFKTRITRGDSLPGGLVTLQILRSPFDACVASMSDFCFDEEACQASEIIGDGPREVVRV